MRRQLLLLVSCDRVAGRRTAPDMPRPFRVWWYPLPNLVALFGWIFLFSTSGPEVIAFGLGTLALGFAAYFAWAWRTRQWPFGVPKASAQV